MLSPSEISQFNQQGFLTAPSGISTQTLNALTKQVDDWVEESRLHTDNYGETIEHKARFDLEPGHTAEHPKLRRVANPVDVSGIFQKVLWEGVIVDQLKGLLGDSIKYHHCKLNIKMPGMDTRVEYHQDHIYDPHTNDSVVVALIMLDDQTVENGCLKVVPGSHKKRYSHFKDGKFTGAIDTKHYEEFGREEVYITGKKGDVCFQHTWTVHGSAANVSSAPRRLLICDYVAADSIPLTAPALPSKYSGKLICGEPALTVRMIEAQIPLREPYQQDSFFGLQGQAGR